MKLVTIALIIMSFTMVSCGGDDKDKSSSNKGFSTSKLTTQEGYYNTQNGDLEVGGKIYPANQAYAQVMNAALQQAYAKNLQPRIRNGVPKFRAKITAQLINYNQNYSQPYNTYQQGTYNQGYNQTGHNQNTLMLQNVVLY